MGAPAEHDAAPVVTAREASRATALPGDVAGEPRATIIQFVP